MFKNVKCFLFLLMILNIQCSRSQESLEKCREAFTKASQEINSFQIDKDRSKLEKALEYLEVSTSCEKTKLMSIELKIATLNTLSAYKENILFIDSLKANDFDKAYKKEMYLNFVKGKLCQDDIKCREKYLKKALSSIDDYIVALRVFDENVCYDLFTIKAEILTPSELSEDIQNFINKYPEHKDYFEILESTFIENEQISISN